jgi:pimeloyl-ACP methyl ester carboxylesterase
MRTWLLLRGWAREARHWGHFPDELRVALPGSEVRTLDLPGNGRLHERRSPLTVPAMVDELRALHVERDKRYSLLGLSLGAMVCIDWTLRYPGEVEACALLNTSLRPFSRFYERLRPGAYGTILRSALFEADAARREAAILRMTSATARADAALAAAWAGYAHERPVSRANVLRQLIAAARYRVPARAPRSPLLLLAGARDRLVNPSCSARLASVWSVPLAVHPTAGHDLTLDDGPWVAAQVKEWLKRRAVQAADSGCASPP